MNKKISLGAAIAFMLIVATATFTMTTIYSMNRFNVTLAALQEREAQFKKFGELDRQVRQNYFGTINETQLMDSVANGYMAGLGDEYAMYIDARTYEKMLRDQQGTLVGIGAEMEVGADGYLTVTQVYAASPAETEGLAAGDIIVQVDGTGLTPENGEAMLDAISGEAGTRVTLLVRRDASETLMEIPRRTVIIPSVYASMLEGDEKIGYIWIEEFNDYTSDQFSREVDRLVKNNGATALILDVRDNKGGVLREATRMLDKLLPGGLIASYTDTQGGSVEYISDVNQVDIPMVVLVNNNTASAAELFAFSLRNYDKARIVGVNTAGKGVIQSTIPLEDGSAITITVAELLVGSSSGSTETFNKTGVKPDYEVALGPDENWRELSFDTDAQMIKALEVALGMRRATDSTEGGETSEAEQPEVSQPSEEETSAAESSDGEESDASEGEEESGGEESEDEEESASAADAEETQLESQ